MSPAVEISADEQGPYFALFNAVSDAIVIFEPDREIILEANESACRMYGCPRNELIGRSLKSFSSDVLRGEQAIAHTLNTGVLSEFETYQTRKNGEPIHLVVNASVFDFRGQRAILAILRDITALRKVQDTLHENEQRYRSLIEQSIAGIYVIQDGIIIYANPTMSLICGYSLDEIIGLRAIDLVVPEDQPLVAERISQRLSRKSEFEAYTFRSRRKDGSVVHVQTHGSTIEYAGRPAISGLLIDVSRQRESELVLQRSEQRFRALVQHSSDMITVLSPEGLILEESESVERILGYRVGELYGTSAFDWIPVEEHDLARTRLQEMLARPDDTHSIEIHFRHKDGSWRLLETIGTNQLNNPAIRGLVINSRDITERQQAAIELEESRRRAEEATRAKSDFLAQMSHEIRTPMNGVLGMTELLLGTALSRSQREYAEAIYHSGEVLLNLINDILDLSKIEAGRLELDTHPFDLWNVVQDVTELYAARAEEKSLRLATFIAASVPQQVTGDPLRLRQVLTNLVNNAVKFTQQGQVIVHVSLEEETTSGLTVRFQVADSGIGLPQEVRDLLFQPFVQADASIARQFGGTGLGLTISRQLVEMMGGRIDVESTPEHGSTFSFTVQLGKIPGAESGLQSQAENLKGLHTLVVDHNPVTRELMIQQLTEWGLEVEGIETGPQALRRLFGAAASSNPFRLALIDQDLPKMDGKALARAVKAIPVTSEAALILMTGFSTTLSPEEAEDLSLADCLLKPVGPARLLEALLGWVCPRTAEPPAVMLPDRNERPPARGRILLAEDNEINRKVATLMLEKAGFEVDTVVNGARALNAVQEREYQLVLMDCQMPEMDGYEATTRIRQLDGPAANVPIVALTANAMQNVRERCLAVGMNDYLAKPFRRDIFEDIVLRWSGTAMIPPSGTTPTPDVYDPLHRMLQELEAELGADELHSLRTTFLEGARSYLHQIREGIDSGNTESVEAAAHALKGASLVFHALELSELCERLEGAAALHHTRSLPDLLFRIEQAFLEIEPVLNPG